MNEQIEICEDFCDFCCEGLKQKLISFDVGHSVRWVSVCEGCLEEALQKLKGVS